MLYRFSLKAGLLTDKKWCGYSNVDDWVYTDSFIIPHDEEVRKRDSSAHFVEGRLALVPKENRLVKDTWIALDIPLRLRDEKNHLVGLTFEYRLSIKETSVLNRMINKILNPVGKDVSYSYSEKRIVQIRNSEEKKGGEKEEQGKKSTEKDVKDKYRIAVFYHGVGKIAQYYQLMKRLVDNIQSLRGGMKPQIKPLKGNEIRRILKEHMPKSETVFTQPPDGNYSTVDRETMEAILSKVWPNVREFVLEFLDCEAVSKLFPHSMSCIPLLPNIIQITYKYLLLVSQKSRVNIAVNISKRKNKLFVALAWIVWSEIKNKGAVLINKRKYRKEIDKMGNLLKNTKERHVIGQAY
jgi:hypothetical protein